MENKILGFSRSDEWVKIRLSSGAVIHAPADVLEAMAHKINEETERWTKLKN